MAYPDLNEVARRPQQYWNADGLPELIMGGLWILWGVALGLPRLLPRGAWEMYYWMAVPAVLVIGGVASNWLTKKLKERFTYPRGGYVRFPDPAPLMMIVSVLLAAAIASGLAVLVVKAKTQGIPDLAAPACGVLLAAAMLIPALRWRLPHLLVLSGASLIAAVLIGQAGLTLEPGMISLFLSLGAVSMILGAIRLRLFLHSHPA